MAISLGAMTLTGSMAMAQPGQGYGRNDDRGDRGRGNDRNGNWDRGDRHDRNDRNDRPGNWRSNDRNDRANNWRSNDRNWRNWRNYDYNRPERGGSGYYAENYYRGGYRAIPVTRNTRIYRGYNGNYYCRRNDGTTGLIVGAALGGVIGNSLDNGRSSLLGTLLGAGAGGLLGREVDRGGVSCR
ncbi:MAG: glycine zipper 2TM domain-containing protein [Sphingobium sp.]